jgi:hypothetical protein
MLDFIVKIIQFHSDYEKWYDLYQKWLIEHQTTKDGTVPPPPPPPPFKPQ